MLLLTVKCVVPGKYSYPPQGGWGRGGEGRGYHKPKFLKQRYEAKLEFQEG